MHSSDPSVLKQRPKTIFFVYNIHCPYLLPDKQQSRYWDLASALGDAAFLERRVKPKIASWRDISEQVLDICEPFRTAARCPAYRIPADRKSEGRPASQNQHGREMEDLPTAVTRDQWCTGSWLLEMHTDHRVTIPRVHHSCIGISEGFWDLIYSANGVRIYLRLCLIYNVVPIISNVIVDLAASQWYLFIFRWKKQLWSFSGQQRSTLPTLAWAP